MNFGQLGSIGEELKRNPRLRIGLIVIVGLIVIYQINGLGRWRDQIASEYSDNVARLERIRGISRQDGWAGRAADADAMLKALKAEISDADSVGLAQATFQGWLGGLVKSTGVPLAISMGTPTRVDGRPSDWKIPAKLTGRLGPRGAMELIRQIESRKELVTIDSIQLTNDRYPTLSLDLSTYYRVAQ